MTSGGPSSPAPAHRMHSDSQRDPLPGTKPGQSAGLIELTVEKPQYLLHAFDPSPIAGRELDEPVERFIVHSAEDAPALDYRMIIHMRGTVPEDEANSFATAVRTHFDNRRKAEIRDRRSLMRQGRQALAIGIGFLFACGLAGHFALKALPAPFGLFVEQGLLIVGWVANWRPIEIFLYDWRPLVQNQKLFAALARMDVEFRPIPAQRA